MRVCENRNVSSRFMLSVPVTEPPLCVKARTTHVCCVYQHTTGRLVSFFLSTESSPIAQVESLQCGLEEQFGRIGLSFRAVRPTCLRASIAGKASFNTILAMFEGPRDGLNLGLTIAEKQPGVQT